MCILGCDDFWMSSSWASSIFFTMSILIRYYFNKKINKQTCFQARGKNPEDTCIKRHITRFLIIWKLLPYFRCKWPSSLGLCLCGPRQWEVAEPDPDLTTELTLGWPTLVSVHINHLPRRQCSSYPTSLQWRHTHVLKEVSTTSPLTHTINLFLQTYCFLSSLNQICLFEELTSKWLIELEKYYNHFYRLINHLS